MKRIITIFFALAVLQACTKDNSHKEGLLSFGIAGTEHAIVQNDGNHSRTATATKAGTTVLPNVDAGSFVVNAGNTDDTTSLIAATTFSSIMGKTYIVEQGSYVASAYNSTEEQTYSANGGFGQAQYYGKAHFSVTAGRLANVEIPCSVVNSMVSVVLDETFLKAFDLTSTTISISTNAARSMHTLDFTDANGRLLTSGDAAVSAPDPIKSAFYPAGTDLYISINARLTSLSGNGTVKNYTYEGSASADGALVTTSVATWHKIIISADLSNAPKGITIKVGQKQETLTNGISIDGYNSGSLNEDE